MAESYHYSFVFRKFYDSKKPYFKELRPKLKNYMAEDYEIAIRLGIENAEIIYEQIVDELKKPMSQTQSGIYLLVNEITKYRCFIEELASYQRQTNNPIEHIVHSWIEQTFFEIYAAPVSEQFFKEFSDIIK